MFSGIQSWSQRLQQTCRCVFSFRRQKVCAATRFSTSFAHSGQGGVFVTLDPSHDSTADDPRSFTVSARSAPPPTTTSVMRIGIHQAAVCCAHSVTTASAFIEGSYALMGFETMPRISISKWKSGRHSAVGENSSQTSRLSLNICGSITAGVLYGLRPGAGSGAWQ